MPSVPPCCHISIPMQYHGLCQAFFSKVSANTMPCSYRGYFWISADSHSFSWYTENILISTCLFWQSRRGICGHPKKVQEAFSAQFLQQISIEIVLVSSCKERISAVSHPGVNGHSVWHSIGTALVVLWQNIKLELFSLGTADTSKP